jgi:RNA polymerase sigma factor (TIGR02999 family)
VSQSFPESSGITRLIQCARDGDSEAAARLWENIYQQVKEISIRALAKESRPLTIAATDIAHEAYLKLSDAKDFRFENRAHLMATVARAIRRLLVDHSRSRSATKRGGHWNKQEFDEDAISLPLQDHQWTDLDEALDELERHDARLAKLVELRFFGGMTLDEVADSMGMSRRTIASDWALARAWLRRRLESNDE